VDDSTELSIEKLGPYEIQQRDNIISLQEKFRQLDRSVIRSMIIGKQTFKRSLDLNSLLQHSRNCEASDSRDRVYTFLRLAHKGYDVIPNYKDENDIQEVLVETAKGIIQFDKSLDILQHVHRGRDELGSRLPSWVHDWTSRETQTSLDQHSCEEAGPFNALKGLPASVEFSSALAMTVIKTSRSGGIFLDYIEEADFELSDLDGVSSFLTMGGNPVIGPKSARSDDEVWILYGSKKPVVLRRNMNTDNVYRYLRSAFVYEKGTTTFSPAMFGEIIEKMQQGALDKNRERAICKPIISQ
jgi:hypothetical protein